MLPFSHDEVVHGKSPMIYKMPGLEHEKFANLRLLYTYMYLHPGAKLLFMGNEFGQTSEWDENKELDWYLLQHESHKKLKECVLFLSHFYRNHPILYKDQFEPNNFEWTMIDKKSDGVVAFKRKGKFSKDDILVILNLSHKDYINWGMKVTGKLQWKEVFNSNDIKYWGSGSFQNIVIPVEILEKKNKVCEINLQIPALSALILQ
jgi:1,4-alpha-glucan branching enzyme